MYKVLIVDDDKLARKGLISIVPWQECGMTVVGDVSNGVTALEFIEKNKESKKTLIVELGESEEEQLEKYIVEIEMLVQQKEVPPPINGKQCKKCAYYEYCYI